MVNKRDGLKSQVDNLMNQYDKEEIDGQTYLSRMMDLTASYNDKDNSLSEEKQD